MSQFSGYVRKSLLLIGGCTAFTVGFAGGPEPAPSPAPWVFFPALPGVSLYGFGGNGWTGIGDAMAPVFGQPLNFFYVDPQIYYHNNNEYTVSVGGGERWLVSPEVGILGAYVFGDWNRINDGNHFWFVNPGLERLGSIIDLSANLYIPVNDQQIDNGTKFADQDGNFSEITFSGHNQYDALVNTFDSTGWGGDAQIGIHLPWLPFFQNSEVFLGGYYFAPKSADNIGGGSVRLQVPITNYFSALFSEAYDSQFHNTLKGGITFWFGGRHTLPAWRGDLRERMVDPVQRGLIAVAGGSHTVEPSIHQEQIIENGVLEFSNISFFVPPGHAPEGNGAAQGDGTFENPYINMTQANINDANFNNNYNFYINSGNYYAVYGSSNPDYLVLNNDRLFGRQNNFKQEADGSNRPVINFTEGGFEIPDNVNDSFNDLILKGSNQTTHAGIWVDHEGSSNQTLQINGSDVKYFGDGIDFLNSGTGALTVVVSNSLISDNNGSGELFAQGAEGGIAAVNNGGGSLKLSIDESSISNNSKTITGKIPKSFTVGGLAVVNESGETMLNINESGFSDNDVTATGIISSGSAGGLAVTNFDSMTVDIDQSSFYRNDITITDSSFAAAGGAAIVNNNGGNLVVDINRSNFFANTIVGTSTGAFVPSVGPVGGLAVSNEGDMTLRVKQSAFYGNDITATNSGITVAGGLATLNTDNMTLDIDGSSFYGNDIIMSNNFFTLAAGGLAIDNGSANNMTVNVDQSAFYDNDIEATDSTVDVAGGFAVANLGNSMTLHVGQSSFSGNDILAMNSTIDAAGGLAAANSVGNSSMALDIDKSTFNNNDVEATDSNIFVGGGLAALSVGNTMALDINQSVFNGNSINATNTFIFAAGGLAALNDGNTMNLNIDGSQFSGNYVTATQNSTINSAGGLAADNEANNMTLGISSSDFNGNKITATSSSLNSAGGLAVNNTPGIIGGMTLDIDGSNFNDNEITASTNTSILSAGGLAFDNLEDSTMTLDIYKSDFIGNKVTATTNSTLFSAAGLAAFNVGAMTLDVDSSSFLKNEIRATDSDVFTAGGLSVFNIGGMTLDANNSSFSKNDVKATNSTINAAGGFAAENDGGNTLALDIDNSSFSGNEVIANSGTEIGSAGGMAIENQGNTLTLDINQSSFSGNTILANNSFIFAAGGLATDNFSVMTLDIDNSSFSKNDVVAENGSIIQAAGGFAVFNSTNTINIDVDDSSFSKNLITANNATIDASGGFAAYNEPRGNMLIDINGSSFTKNDTTAVGSSTIGAAGGVAIDSFGSTSATISQSEVLFNDTGIAVNSNGGPTTIVTFDQSILTGNKIGLSAMNNSQIDVTNPIFFNGKVIFDNTSTITFPDIGTVPVSGDHIFCKFGNSPICVIK